MGVSVTTRILDRLEGVQGEEVVYTAQEEKVLTLLSNFGFTGEEDWFEDTLGQSWKAQIKATSGQFEAVLGSFEDDIYLGIQGAHSDRPDREFTVSYSYEFGSEAISLHSGIYALNVSSRGHLSVEVPNPHVAGFRRVVLTSIGTNSEMAIETSLSGGGGLSGVNRADFTPDEANQDLLRMVRGGDLRLYNPMPKLRELVDTSLNGAFFTSTGKALDRDNFLDSFVEYAERFHASVRESGLTREEGTKA